MSADVAILTPMSESVDGDAHINDISGGSVRGTIYANLSASEPADLTLTMLSSDG